MTKRGRSRRKVHPQGESALQPIPGYGQVDLQTIASLQDNSPQPTLAETMSRLISALRGRDVVAVLAKTGEQMLKELGMQIGPGSSGMEQVHAEVLQAFALSGGRGTSVPSSPSSMVRIWSHVQRNLDAYVRSIAPGQGADVDVRLARSVRLRTIYHRNVFNSDDAAEIVPGLLSLMDRASERELGYRLSDLAKAMFALVDDVADRFRVRVERERALRNQPGAAADGVIETMIEESHISRRMWRIGRGWSLTPEGRAWAGFQMAEMLCAPIFTFTRTQLEARFGTQISDALFTLSLSFGSIREEDLAKVFLANPVWGRPFVALDNDTLFLPLPFLFVSFPFTIVEGRMAGNDRLNEAYGAARTRYLEDEIERIVRKSLPSARVHRGVKWKDPDTKVEYEHDVIAILGMQVLIFEAKSGKLSPSAKRGAADRLRKNFKALFIEPGVQATRLETLLASRRNDVELKDHKGEVVQFETAGPSQVHKFGVCIEQVAGITGSRRFFCELGLLEQDSAWAPILTLGELRMIADRLDTEVSFLHYLTRRMTADDLFDFSGDEQDLLSMYLVNRFIIDPRALEGRQVIFHEADAAVRGRTTPRSDRSEFAIHGPALPPMWNLIAKENYHGAERHRFDILIALLNQSPGALERIAHTVRRWRGGVGTRKGNTLSSRADIGSRVFVVAVHLASEHPGSEDEWREQARFIAYDLHEKLGATDCVVVLKSRRSRSPTFDGISFFRFPRIGPV